MPPRKIAPFPLSTCRGFATPRVAHDVYRRDRMIGRTLTFAALVVGTALGVACAAADPVAPALAAGAAEDAAAVPAPTAPVDASVPPPPDPVDASVPTSDQPPVKKVLDFTWQGEDPWWFCGPSATYMALTTQMANPPTQDEVATELGTTSDGTSDIGKVVNVLNKYIAGASYVTRVITDPPTTAQHDKLKADLVARISKGQPVVANVISGWRPPMYPTSGTIYHYIAVLGYDDSGQKALIADPGAEGHGGSTAWNNVPESYWVDLDDLAVWIAGKGYTGS
jgi:hypothetical protein